jgi:hypothetical protein
MGLQLARVNRVVGRISLSKREVPTPGRITGKICANTLGTIFRFNTHLRIEAVSEVSDKNHGAAFLVEKESVLGDRILCSRFFPFLIGIYVILGD